MRLYHSFRRPSVRPAVHVAKMDISILTQKQCGWKNYIYKRLRKKFKFKACQFRKHEAYSLYVDWLRNAAQRRSWAFYATVSLDFINFLPYIVRFSTGNPALLGSGTFLTKISSFVNSL
jgi:hypothetical protein